MAASGAVPAEPISAPTRSGHTEEQHDERGLSRGWSLLGLVHLFGCQFAKLEAMRGRLEEARDLVARARSILQEVALTVWLAGPLTQMAGWVEILVGDPATAERDLRLGAETLRRIGELSWLSTAAGILAEAVYVQGRYDDEVQPFLQVCEETAGSEDAYSQSLLRSVRAKLLARRGDAETA